MNLNRVAVPFAIEDTTLELDVEPRRTGDESGAVELVLESNHGGYNLSGDLYFELPASSWPVNELYFDVHLPDVFNYTWTGGSLAPVASSPEVAYTYTVPLPGKRLAFHQYLISKSSGTIEAEEVLMEPRRQGALKELLETIEVLPEEQLREVTDFAGFLGEKRASKGPQRGSAEALLQHAGRVRFEPEV